MEIYETSRLKEEKVKFSITIRKKNPKHEINNILSKLFVLLFTILNAFNSLGWGIFCKSLELVDRDLVDRDLVDKSLVDENLKDKTLLMHLIFTITNLLSN